MIRITVYQKEDGRLYGFHCKGHAGYAESGSDIICSAVSALTITTINAIDSLTEVKYSYAEEEKDGELELRLEETSDESELLLKSLLLGLNSIQDSYGKKYIQLKFVNSF